MRLLSPRELRGVLAHEMAHVANRDILIQTVAGVLASAITAIANFAQFAAIFGGRSGDGEERGNPLAMLLMALLAPMAAGLIQMAISRTREYKADATGASFCRDPLALASALDKLTAYSRRIPCRGTPPRKTCSSFRLSPAEAWPTCSVRIRPWRSAWRACGKWRAAAFSPRRRMIFPLPDRGNGIF